MKETLEQRLQAIAEGHSTDTGTTSDTVPAHDKEEMWKCVKALDLLVSESQKSTSRADRLAPCGEAVHVIL